MTVTLNLVGDKEADELLAADPLALLNFNRFADWKLPFTPENAKQAVLAFDGDVYDGLAAKTLSAADLDFAIKCVGGAGNDGGLFSRAA